MAYRDQEAALRARIEVLEAESKRLGLEHERLEREVARERPRVESLTRRLGEAGQGAGPRGARKDRIDVAVWVLALAGLPLLYFHFDWHGYVDRDPTVIPAILWLGTPGLLAAVVGWPYRRVSPSCVLGALLGLAFVAIPLANVVLGLVSR